MDVIRLDPITRGDARTLTVTLTLAGEAWTPVPGQIVRCTGKHSPADTDDQAVFRKDSGVGGGITVVDNVATVEVAPADTASLDPRLSVNELICDVQIASSADDPVTVARFILPVEPDVTHTAP